MCGLMCHFHSYETDTSTHTCFKLSSTIIIEYPSWYIKRLKNVVPSHMIYIRPSGHFILSTENKILKIFSGSQEGRQSYETCMSMTLGTCFRLELL